MIQAIIADEPAGKPLSDDAIAMMVSEKGVKLARRTVAKYRDMLKIPLFIRAPSPGPSGDGRRNHVRRP